MDALTLFGFAAVSLMLLCYALEDRSPWYVFGFAIACALFGLYAVLQGGMAIRDRRGRLHRRRAAPLEVAPQACVSCTVLTRQAVQARAARSARCRHCGNSRARRTYRSPRAREPRASRRSDR